MSQAPPTWRLLLEDTAREIGAEHEARWIIQEVTGMRPGELARALDEPAPGAAAATVAEMAARRRDGEPLQYVLGRWQFRFIELEVDRRALIPRPETEQVVGAALEELAAIGTPDPVAVDLGTGSGAIALALGVEVPSSRVWAVDSSPGALALAEANRALVEAVHPGTAGRVSFLEGSWYAGLPAELRGQVALVVSNPPYVSEAELADLPPEVSGWEPLAALVAGESGLEALAVVIGGAPSWLARPGALVVEMAPGQRAACEEMASRAGFASVKTLPDLSGRPRALVCLL